MYTVDVYENRYGFFLETKVFDTLAEAQSYADTNCFGFHVDINNVPYLIGYDYDPETYDDSEYY